MRRMQLLALIVSLAIGSSSYAGKPNVSFGFHFGGRPCYRPYRPYSYFYYRPAPIYYVPRPRIVVERPVVVQQPAPVIVRQAQPSVSQSFPAPAPLPQQPVTDAPTPRILNDPARNQTIETSLSLLRSPDKEVRREAVMQLGRLRAEQAVQPLSATLAGDQEAEVRDAAARALGLISSPRALASLTYAAQADRDRDVRRSAQFAVEIIKSNQQIQ